MTKNMPSSAFGNKHLATAAGCAIGIFEGREISDKPLLYFPKIYRLLLLVGKKILTFSLAALNKNWYLFCIYLIRFS